MKTIRSANAGLMLAQRLRRWPNNKPALACRWDGFIAGRSPGRLNTISGELTDDLTDGKRPDYRNTL